jgi:hypothetical protein
MIRLMTPCRTVFGCAAAALLSVSSACSSFDGGDDRAPGQGGGSAAMATSRVASLTPEAPGRDWSCLDAPERSPSTTGPERVVFSLQVVDIGTGEAKPGLQVRGCGLTDLACEQPVVEPIASDRDGWFRVPLLAGFTGYLEMTGPGVMSSLIFMSEPFAADSDPSVPALAVSFTTVDALARALGITFDPMLGLVAFRVLDCQGMPAPGVAFSTSGTGTPYYFVGGLPTLNVRSTDAQGLGGFVNSAPGLAQVDVLAPSGESIAGPRGLVIRPGWLSTIFVRPPRSLARAR